MAGASACVSEPATRKSGPWLLRSSRAAIASVPAAAAAQTEEKRWTASVKSRKKKSHVHALQRRR